ncbi:hypothetical protein B4155_3561 [Bacillus cereus]|nr:hypothetical protein B4155_3561 [Bacillus cereus]
MKESSPLVYNWGAFWLIATNLIMGYIVTFYTNEFAKIK